MAEKTKTFEDVRTTGVRHNKGCPRCGAERNAGMVQAGLRALGANSGGAGGRISSRTKSFCEPCAVEVYQAVEAVILKEAKVDG